MSGSAVFSFRQRCLRELSYVRTSNIVSPVSADNRRNSWSQVKPKQATIPASTCPAPAFFTLSICWSLSPKQRIRPRFVHNFIALPSLSTWISVTISPPSPSMLKWAIAPLNPSALSVSDAVGAADGAPMAQDQPVPMVRDGSP